MEGGGELHVCCAFTYPYLNWKQIATLPLVKVGSCLKTGQHSIAVIVYLLLPMKYIFFDSVSDIQFNFFYVQKPKIKYFRLISTIAMALSPLRDLFRLRCISMLLANSRTSVLFLHASKLCKKQHPMTVKRRGNTYYNLFILLCIFFCCVLFLLLCFVSSVVLSFLHCKSL